MGASSSIHTSYVNERLLMNDGEGHGNTTAQKNDPDAAHVHRCGEYDGIWNNHAADEHGTGRSDLPVVLDRDGRGVDGDCLRICAGGSIQSAAGGYVGLRRGCIWQAGVFSRILSLLSLTGDRQCCNRHLRGGISCVVCALVVVDPHCHLHWGDWAALAHHHCQFWRSRTNRAHWVGDRVGGDHPRRVAFAHRLVLV